MKNILKSLVVFVAGYAAALAAPALAESLSVTVPVELSWSVYNSTTFLPLGGPGTGTPKYPTLKAVLVGQMDADVTVTERGPRTTVSLSPGGMTLCAVTLPTGVPLKLSASNEPGTGYELSWAANGAPMTATRTFVTAQQ